jgi:hypothetical protein
MAHPSHSSVRPPRACARSASASRAYASRVCLGLAGCLLIPATVLAQAAPAPWNADKALARIRLICLGDYLIKKGGHPAVGPADIELCHRALRDDGDDGLVIAGCRGIGVLSRRAFFGQTERRRLDEIVDLLIRKLRDGNSQVAHSAGRALISFDTQPAPGKDTRKRLLSAPQCRRIVSQCLASVISKDPATQWRAGSLLRAVVDDVGAQVHVEIARTLLVAIARLAKRELPDAKKEKRALDSLKSALAVVPAPDAAIGREMATLFLVDARRLAANHWSIYSAADCLRALANCVPVLEGEPRTAVVEFLHDAARDDKLLFMTTSGMRSPFHHHGVMALMQAVPVMTASELASAAKTVRALRERFEARMQKAGRGIAFNQKDLDSVFGGTDAVFATRRKALEGAKQPK